MATNIAYYTTTSVFSYWVCGEYTWNEVNYGDTKISQTFQVIEGAWDVARIYFRMIGYFKDGEEAGNLTVEVRETNEGGDLLGSFTKDRLTVTDVGWYYFEVTDLELSSGNTYCLVLSCPNGFYDADENDYDYIRVTRNPAAGYGSGIARHYNEVDGWSNDFSGDTSVDFCFIVTGDEVIEAPIKPTNPIPENTDTEVDWSDLTLSWEDGGGADTYNVYVGDAADNLTLISSAQVGLSKTLSSAQRELFTSTCYWRIDATNDSGTTTGDVWQFTVEAPGKATDPTPTDDQENLLITGKNQLKQLTWSAPDDETPDYLVYFRAEGGDWVLQETITDDSTEHWFSVDILDAFSYYSIYEWRVDTYSPETELTTTGDTWTFITQGESWFTSYSRRSDYNANKVWQPGTGWVDIADWTDAVGYDFEYTGGGRFKNRVLVIGHKVLYFGSI